MLGLAAEILSVVAGLIILVALGKTVGTLLLFGLGVAVIAVIVKLLP